MTKQGRRRRPLDRDELAEFKRQYGTRSDEDLVETFGLTVAKIAALAEELCLSKDKAFVKKTGGQSRMPRWDLASIEALKFAYPTISNHELAQQLGRSIKSVVSKAHTLGLKKTHARLQQMGRDNVAKRYEQ